MPSSSPHHPTSCHNQPRKLFIISIIHLSLGIALTAWALTNIFDPKYATRVDPKPTHQDPHPKVVVNLSMLDFVVDYQLLPAAVYLLFAFWGIMASCCCVSSIRENSKGLKCRKRLIHYYRCPNTKLHSVVSIMYIVFIPLLAFDPSNGNSKINDNTSVDYGWMIFLICGVAFQPISATFVEWAAKSALKKLDDIAELGEGLTALRGVVDNTHGGDGGGGGGDGRVSRESF